MESADRFAATGELVALSGAAAGAANACFACHGLDGAGDGALAPRLAGIDAGYLERQLIAYADGRRKHAAMGYIAQKLDPRERRAVSAYYAAKPALVHGRDDADDIWSWFTRYLPAIRLSGSGNSHGDAGLP